MTPSQFQKDSNIEGKGDYDEISFGVDVHLFPSFAGSSSSNRKKSKDVANKRSTKSKASSLEENLDGVINFLSTNSTTKSTQNFPPDNSYLTIEDCMSIVITFPGFEEGSDEYLRALCVLIEKKNRDAFMMDSGDSHLHDDGEEYWVDEDLELKRAGALVVKGIILARDLRNKRTPCHTSDRTGNMFINEMLNGHPRRCYEIFRLDVLVFRLLCVDLFTRYGLTQTRNISIEESVGIFLLSLAHGCTNRFVQESFNHSGETFHRHFYKVLVFVLKMSAEIIKPATNYNDDVPAHILNNPRYYPMFEDCIGAIDGIHVRASVRLNDQPKNIGRKGYATQNIMAACDFNMCFTFVWAGWEGTAHDTRIFNEALQIPNLKFPHPMGEKYYVVDAGYPNTKGYLAPYKGANIRYHIPVFRRGQTSAMRAPRGSKETLNYYHSSLRNIIEQTFGVWKARWALLRDMHVNYTYDHQVKIVIALMAIHNFNRKAGWFDETFETAQQEFYNPIEDGHSDEDHKEVPATNRTGNDVMFMAAIRDVIAQEIVKSQREM
ncbi:uncharacterized protein LOC143605954 [Bidens hawaiensis]|uniref:uncharacterized protein LOC143605954 n=1 Tax=Bidens hawaiensis TaxID=980011 RepID=UPI00404B76A4